MKDDVRCEKVAFCRERKKMAKNPKLSDAKKIFKKSQKRVTKTKNYTARRE
jgi:hypothetical protein